MLDKMMWGRFCRTVLVILVLRVLVVLRFCEGFQKDLIERLPGQPPVSFKQYSGYVTVDRERGRALFYYFVEAQHNASAKPLVVWLNGGPGCSSIGVGAFSENGPFQPRGKVLVQNPFSWNKAANVLYLETPAGVGFSYSNDTSFYRSVNDTLTARDNVIFLQRWFRKFPQYRNRDLYITGESYAGHYVPQWAVKLTQLSARRPRFNLKGIAIGNPLINFKSDFNARAEYLWSHGLISDNTYRKMANVCNYGRYVQEFYSRNLSAACETVNSLVDSEVSNFVSSYDVTLNVCIGSQSKTLTLTLNSGNSDRKDYASPSESSPDVCVEDESKKFLNRPDVQTALHVFKISGSTRPWDICSGKIVYDHQNLEIPTVPLLGKLIKAGVRVFVYSGDQDSVIPLTSTRTLIDSLAESLGLRTSSPYRVWFQGNQVGGWTQQYGKLLTFATVRGASHEVPFSQPERAMVLLLSFLSGKSLPHSVN